MLGLGCGVWGISTCPPRRERGAITEDRAGGEVPVLIHGFGRSHAGDTSATSAAALVVREVLDHREYGKRDHDAANEHVRDLLPLGGLLCECQNGRGGGGEGGWVCGQGRSGLLVTHGSPPRSSAPTSAARRSARAWRGVAKPSLQAGARALGLLVVGYHPHRSFSYSGHAAAEIVEGITWWLLGLSVAPPCTAAFAPSALGI